MYAVVEIKGKQYRAEQGQMLQVDKVDAEPGSQLEFDSVLLTSDGDKIAVGSPYVAGAKVKTTVDSHTKGDKVIVFKYKPKKDYRRKMGHRQQYSLLKVDAIEAA
jgi:large subunit ribosomal protein L21